AAADGRARRSLSGGEQFHRRGASAESSRRDRILRQGWSLFRPGRRIDNRSDGLDLMPSIEPERTPAAPLTRISRAWLLLDARKSLSGLRRRAGLNISRGSWQCPLPCRLPSREA